MSKRIAQLFEFDKLSATASGVASLWASQHKPFAAIAPKGFELNSEACDGFKLPKWSDPMELVSGRRNGSVSGGVISSRSRGVKNYQRKGFPTVCGLNNAVHRTMPTASRMEKLAIQRNAGRQASQEPIGSAEINAFTADQFASIPKRTNAVKLLLHEPVAAAVGRAAMVPMHQVSRIHGLIIGLNRARVNTFFA